MCMMHDRCSKRFNGQSIVQHHQEMHTTKEKLEQKQIMKQQSLQRTSFDLNSSPLNTSNHDWERSSIIHQYKKNGADHSSILRMKCFPKRVNWQSAWKMAMQREFGALQWTRAPVIKSLSTEKVAKKFDVCSSICFGEEEIGRWKSCLWKADSWCGIGTESDSRSERCITLAIIRRMINCNPLRIEKELTAAILDI